MNQERNEQKNEDLYEFERSLIDDRELFGLDNMTLYVQSPKDENSGEAFIGEKFFYHAQIPSNYNNIDDENDGNDGLTSFSNVSYTEQFNSVNNHEEIPRVDDCISGFEMVEDCRETNTTDWSYQTSVGTPSQYDDPDDDDVIIIEPCPETNRVSLKPLDAETYKRNFALRRLFELTESRKEVNLSVQKRCDNAVEPHNEEHQRDGIDNFPRNENERRFNKRQYYINVYRNKSNLERFDMNETSEVGGNEGQGNQIQNYYTRNDLYAPTNDDYAMDYYIPVDDPEQLILI